MSSEQKTTYTTIGSSPGFDRAFEAALETVRASFPRTRPSTIGAASTQSSEKIVVRSPIDRRVVLGEVRAATAADTARAIGLAQAAFPAWRRRPWPQRVALLRRAADELARRKYELGALMAWECGKTRIEAMAEVEESADLIRYYCALLEENDGFRRPLQRLAPDEATESVLRPYGAWGVISPFNFPLALAAGMASAALVTGNTVVFKPSSDAPLCGYELFQALRAGGVPDDALHFVAGSGAAVGAALLSDARVQGIAFTGSYDVGMRVRRDFAREYPKPVVIEMGGKNPAIVTASADLDAAAEGVVRSAFGYGGQKCSACSRVYVERAVLDEFLLKLLERSAAITVGNPLEREVFLGPLIHARALEQYRGHVEELRASGAEILLGGGVRTDGDLRHGFYAEPTVVRCDDEENELFYQELFAPILLVAAVDGLDQALALSNRARYGLTAGLFSTDQDEVARFLDEIEAGVTYVNRRAGATTGAWPGVNPFGGWKASGSTGPAALGPHYLHKFLREQSRTVNPVRATRSK